MYSFRNDYSEGAHPKVLEALTATNFVQTCGYGMDPYCAEAAARIRELCAAPEADVHFLVGGTQTNVLVLDALLAPYEAAIAAHTGHINVHETGAVEATGHKVCTVFAPDGKLTPQLVDTVVSSHSGEHMVLPRVVYISNTTEVGTLYTKAELIALREYCDAHELYLFLDGARLGSALTSPFSDLTLADLARLTDVFYIGGTKNGVLFGEALVMTTPCPHFRWHIKQRGAMLAKGRLLGVQFEEMFKDGLYEEACGHGIQMALKLKQGFADKGYDFLFDSGSNQQFPILTEEKRAELAEKYDFAFWERVDENRVGVRFCTSWATKESAVDALLADL